jgi:regulatory protein
VRQAERSRTTVKERALRLLTVRSRSRNELRGRLIRAGYEPEEIDVALADLEAVGLVDDERFARELAEHQRRRGLGRRAGMSALRAKGVDRDLAERTMEDVQPEDDAEIAFELARGRLERLRALPPEVVYRRLVGFLLRRGYEPLIASTAVRRALAETESR